MKVVSLYENGKVAQVEQGGTRLEIRADLVEDIHIGDYVLVHAGFAIQKVDEEEAKRTIEVMKALM